jgi:hypothetical protein
MSAGGAARAPIAGPLAALLLPDRSQTLLLRAALAPPDAAIPAFTAWLAGTRAATEAFAAGPRGGRLLAPLIAHNLAAAGDLGAPRLWTYLRTALVREQLRARAARAIYAEALTLLKAAGVRPVVLRGVVASETVYPDPGLRHSHDLDLLVPAGRTDEARRILIDAGFAPGPSLPGGGSRGSRELVHRAGMPVMLHAELFAVPRHRRQPEPLETRVTGLICAGAPAWALDPTDRLLHLLIHAAGAASRASLLWACDAWLTIRAHPEIDWQRLAGEATRRGAALPVELLLRYLAAALDAPVPDPILAELAAQAARATAVDREVALWGAWAGPDARLGGALRGARSARERAALLRWRVLPRPSALALAGRTESGHGSLRFYLGRPWRLIARGLHRPPRPAAVRPGA